MFVIVDYKKLDMTDEEKAYYEEIVKEFSNGPYSGKEQFRDIFDVDADGCITLVRPPSGREIAWKVLHFLANLQQNQYLRRIGRDLDSRLESLERRLRALELKGTVHG